MRRISGQAGSSKSSSEPEAGKAPPTDAMSSTAKLILETLDKMSTPLRDVSKMPTVVSLSDRKRVAEELNSSLSLTAGSSGSARKRPRLGTGPVTGGGGSPLGGPPFRKLYSPLSANRSRPPARVNNHLLTTPRASLNHTGGGSNSIGGSRSSTPSSDLGSGGTAAPPAPPPNLSLASFSTPVSSGAGGGKLRNKVTARIGGLTAASSDPLDVDDPPPPLPSFLTNNVPQLKVSTPLAGFSFGTTTSLEKSDSLVASAATSEKSSGFLTSEKSSSLLNSTSTGLDKATAPLPREERKESASKQASATFFASSQEKFSSVGDSGGPPTVGLTQPLQTVTDKSTAAEDNNNNSNSLQQSSKMFSFTSPVQTVLHAVDGSKPSLPAESRTAVPPAATAALDGGNPHRQSLDGAAAVVPLTNGVSDKEFRFEPPKVVAAQTASMSAVCSVSFSFAAPDVADGKSSGGGKGK